MGLDSANQSSAENYLVREARLDDVPAMVQMRLRQQAHLEERNPSVWRMGDKKMNALPDHYGKVIRNEDALALLAEDIPSGDVVAMGIGTFCLDEQYCPDRSGHIDDIWVDEEHRRRGLCKRIVAHLVAFLEKKGAAELLLRYVHGNTEAEAVWGSFGFHPVVVTATASLDIAREKLNEGT